MNQQRTHYVTTSDGVTIGATVHGHGPPLVFLQGAVGDGDLDWGRLMPHLADRFTCHLLGQRGRGLSGDHPDLRLARQADDVLAYIESVGEPVGLTGWSGGGNLALAVAARSDTVHTVAPFEPGMLNLMDEQAQAALGGILARTGELAAEGRLTDAVRAFLGFPCSEEEIAAAEDVGYVEAAGRYVPNMLAFLQQVMEHGDPSADPAVLGAISAPVTVLIGSDTKSYFAESARYVTDHVPDGRVHEIPGVGHAAALTRPEALAEALTEVFAPAPQRA